MKYADLIDRLDDDTLYTAAMISRTVPEIARAFRFHNRICKSLGWFSRYHCMDQEPDGQIYQYNAWLGSTWKSHIKPEDINITLLPFVIDEEIDQRRFFQAMCLTLLVAFQAGLTAGTILAYASFGQ